VDLSKQYLGRDEYLRRIDGMVYGVNPRDGFFEGSRFRHPDLRFEMDFPQGWATQNQAQGVIGVSPGQDAMVQLNLAQGTPADAARSFLSQQGMQAGDLSRADLNGLPAASAYFQAQSDQARLAGYVAFVSQSGSTFRILAYTTSDRFQGYDGALRSSAGSFRRLTDPAALSVQPKRVKLERVPRAMTLQQFAQQFPSTIPLGELALINRVDSAETLKAGQMVKRVVGK
jgi:predicted Zn-dependent protease